MTTNYTCPACGCVLMHSRGKLCCTNQLCYYVESCSDGGCGCEGIEGWKREGPEGRKEGPEDWSQFEGAGGFSPDGPDEPE